MRCLKTMQSMQEKKRNKEVKSMVKIIESSERYKIQKENIKKPYIPILIMTLIDSFVCHKTTFIECYIQVQISTNSFNTTHWVNFKLLNSCVLPKIEHLQRILSRMTHMMNTCRKVWRGNTFAELIFVTA